MKHLLVLMLAFSVATSVTADVGDPQIQTDHPWYAGELSCSTFDRLFKTQAALYKRVTWRDATTDEDKALASWLWRNTHYWHGEQAGQDLWGEGCGIGGDAKEREYWTGLFAHGYGLCGTTHAQWVGEMEQLLGHGRARSVGTAGHNSFEVFLKGGEYGTGRWVLLDHDLSTVVFTPDGKRLMGLSEIAPKWKQLTDRAYKPERQRGWLPSGLHPDDRGSFAKFAVAEYLSGYAGPPPTVHLRRGETLRRYLQPGLGDGKTFAFWGHNYNTKGIPGPERSRTWVNQPEKMFQSKTGTPHIDGQARFANAVYTYQPNFQNGDYREGIIGEDGEQITFEFQSPYIIASTPAGNGGWGVYEKGGKNGLILGGKVNCTVAVSVDRGAKWIDSGAFADGLDLTDHVKGHRQYWLKFNTNAKALAESGLTMTTVCQCNAAVLPRLRDNGTQVSFEATQRAVVSAGPNLPQITKHVVAGKVDTPTITLELKTPRGEPIRAIYAAAHVRSSSPPDPKILYQIEYSLDSGKTWQALVKDWSVNRQGDEPKDFWSQSLCWGSKPMNGTSSSVQVRFKNNGGKRYARPELHLVYETKPLDGTEVTFAWRDDAGNHTDKHSVEASKASSWKIPTGKNVQTQWVEFRCTK